MKHIGIVAHSAEGAALCYRTICQEGFRRLGAHMHPDITLSSIAMGHSMTAWAASNPAPIAECLLEGVRRVHAAGADFFVVPDNTAHIALDLVLDRLSIPVLRIDHVVCSRAAAAGYRMLGILGTRYTVDGPVYRTALAARGIGHAVPNPDDQARLQRIIFDELVNGAFTDVSRAFLADVIRRLATRGCDAVVLGCTELPLLISQDDSPLPVLDSTRLLARAALSYAMAGAANPSAAWVQ